MRRFVCSLFLCLSCLALVGCVNHSAQEAPAPIALQIQVATQIETVAQRRAGEIAASMSLEERVAQLFFVRCPEQNAAELVAQYQPGGFILFGRDFSGQTKQSMQQKIASYQAEAKIPLLIGVDEEGGTVNRISRYPAFRAAPFWSPQALYREGGWELVRSDTEEKADLLLSLGINVNLAPVCDVSTNPNDYIYDRSFGADAPATAEYVRQVVGVMKEKGLGAVLKHFPGYGNNVDTHSGSAQDSRPYSRFWESDFLPFAAGIQAGAGCILVSHNIVEAIDATAPASLSAEMHRVLRETLAFEGVILSDDLVMQAVQDFAGEEEAAVLALLAGNDLLCCTNFEIQYQAVLQAAREGTLPQEVLEAALQRVLLWKLELGLLA